MTKHSKTEPQGAIAIQTITPEVPEREESAAGTVCRQLYWTFDTSDLTVLHNKYTTWALLTCSQMKNPRPWAWPVNDKERSLKTFSWLGYFGGETGKILSQTGIALPHLSVSPPKKQMEPRSQLSNLERLVLSPTTYEPLACQGMATHTHTHQTHKDDYLGSPSWSFLIFFPCWFLLA